ncbi:hypothetical protein QBC39DRAFT_357747 [Podospora conica]|nr:hypothetical protein QBC39DRAFT_357747 [Schizothecium conicum]
MSAASSPAQAQESKAKPEMVSVGPLQGLPVEIVLQISKILGPRELSSLIKTCRTFYLMLAPQAFEEVWFRGNADNTHRQLRHFNSKPTGHFGCQPHYREKVRDLSMTFLPDIDPEDRGCEHIELSASMLRAVDLSTNLCHLSLDIEHLDTRHMASLTSLLCAAEREWTTVQRLRIKSSAAIEVHVTRQALLQAIFDQVPNATALELPVSHTDSKMYQFSALMEPRFDKAIDLWPTTLLRKVAVTPVFPDCPSGTPTSPFMNIQFAIGCILMSFPHLDSLLLVDDPGKQYAFGEGPVVSISRKQLSSNRHTLFTLLRSEKKALTHLSFPLNRDSAFFHSTATWESRLFPKGRAGPPTKEDVMRVIGRRYREWALIVIRSLSAPLENLCIVDGDQYWQFKLDPKLSEEGRRSFIDRLQWRDAEEGLALELLCMNDVPGGCWPKGFKDLM